MVSGHIRQTSAEFISFGEILRHTARLNVPIFQRGFSWDVNLAKAVLDDLEDQIFEPSDNEGAVESNRFLGAIVLEEITETDGKSYNIIDGQQRITILTLICVAILSLRKSYDDPEFEAKGGALYGRDEGDILFRFAYKVDADQLKLLPRSEDRILFDLILKELEINSMYFTDEIKTEAGYQKHLKIHKKEKLLKVYKTIKERIEKNWLEPGDSEQALKSLDHFWKCVVNGSHFARIILGSNLDPNEVFERLNEMGTPLSSHEMLRNYFLQNASSNRYAPNHTQIIEKAYDVYLKEFDESFGSDKEIDIYILALAQMFDSSAKARTAYPILKRQFSEMLNSPESNGKQSSIRPDFESTTKEFIKYQPIFKALRTGIIPNHLLINLKPADKSKIRNTIRALSSFKVDEATYPYILRLIDGIFNQEIDLTEGIECLELIEIYLIRRGIYGAFRKGLSVFSGLWEESKLNDDFYMTLYHTLIDPELDSSDRFVTDEQLERFLTGKAENSEDGIYRKSKIRRYLIWEYERSLKVDSEVTMPEGYEIDHVVPQSLKVREIAKWRGLSWQDYKLWRHKWANLMPLTSSGNKYKSKKTWDECKKELTNAKGQPNAKCASANECLQEPKWDKKTLLSRAERISEFVMGRWPFPEKPEGYDQFLQRLAQRDENSI